jgi:hypothetical protein
LEFCKVDREFLVSLAEGLKLVTGGSGPVRVAKGGLEGGDYCGYIVKGHFPVVIDKG